MQGGNWPTMGTAIHTTGMVTSWGYGMQQIVTTVDADTGGTWMRCVMNSRQQGTMLLSLLVILAMPGAVRAWEAVATHMQDGDSFRVRQGRTIHTIRLYGIDCPEYQQPGGQQAKKMTASLVKGRRLDVFPVDTDRYGRIVAVVTVDGRVLNAELIRAGWAWVYPRYCTSQPLCRQWEALEREARRARQGIWQDPAPEAPWQWKSHRE